MVARNRNARQPAAESPYAAAPLAIVQSPHTSLDTARRRASIVLDVGAAPSEAAEGPRLEPSTPSAAGEPPRSGERPPSVIRACVRAIAHFRTPDEIAVDLGLPKRIVLTTLSSLDLSPFSPQEGPDAVHALPVLAQAGYRTPREIAANLGIPEPVVRRVLLRAGIAPYRSQQGDSQFRRRVLQLAQTHTAAQIATELGASQDTVRAVLRALSVVPVRANPGRPRLAESAERKQCETPTPDRPASLASIRRQRGLSQSALAEAIGASSSTISLWEQDDRRQGALGLGLRIDSRAIVACGRLGQALGVNPLAIRECRRALLPELEDLPVPEEGEPDLRPAMLPFVHWVRREMATRGWKVADLAEAAGVGRSTANRWVYGLDAPSRSAAARLAEFLGDEWSKERLANWRAEWKSGRSRTRDGYPRTNGANTGHDAETPSRSSIAQGRAAEGLRAAPQAFQGSHQR